VNVLSIVRNTRIRERDAKRDAQRHNATATSRPSWRVKLTARERRSSFAILITFALYLQIATDTGRTGSRTSGSATRSNGKWNL